MDSLFAAALARSQRASLVPLPWDTGPLAMIFGGRMPWEQPAQRLYVQGWLGTSAAPETPKEVEQATMQVKQPAFAIGGQGLDPEAEDELDLHQALGKWFALACTSKGHSRLRGTNEAEFKQSASDCLAKKKPSTMKARYSAVSAYISWCRSRAHPPWPIREMAHYAYVTHLRNTAAPPTKRTLISRRWR